MPVPASIKTVIRCRDVDASRRFYASILNLPIVEEWSEFATKTLRVLRGVR